MACRWRGETKVVAMVRVIPNGHHPKAMKWKIQFPYPVQASSTKAEEEKKQVIAVILADGEEDTPAKNVGMQVGRKDYLHKVSPSLSLGLLHTVNWAYFSW